MVTVVEWQNIYEVSCTVMLCLHSKCITSLYRGFFIRLFCDITHAVIHQLDGQLPSRAMVTHFQFKFMFPIFHTIVWKSETTSIIKRPRFEMVHVYWSFYDWCQIIGHRHKCFAMVSWFICHSWLTASTTEIYLLYYYENWSIMFHVNMCNPWYNT